jgi:hypothetical protein
MPGQGLVDETPDLVFCVRLSCEQDAHAIQGLIAAARGDATLARQRYDEAAAGWHRIAASAYTAEGYLANLVDLGRPPVVGLVEPARELTRISRDRAALASTRPRR